MRGTGTKEDRMATKERVAYVNGKVVPESQASISINDVGFLYGDAVFDTTRTFDKRIFKLKEHLDRFYHSLRYMRIDPGMSKEEMARLTMQVLDANLPLLGPHEDYWVSQRISRGVRGTGKPMVPTVVMECHPLPLKERAKSFRDGLQIVTPSIRRTPPESMSPRAKVHNYINMIQGDLEVKSQNPDALAILLDTNGNIAEGLGSNVFIVKDGALITPRDQFVLGGISRETTIELAQELNIEVRKEDIDLFDAYTADEAFVTSTSYCICPVSKFNGMKVGDGVPGPVTDRLQKAYSGLVGMDIVGQYLAHLK
ncbi:MAG: branched-chain amino acid aminotransferase [SAR202 cluster bacterium]|nr:branched-chain amino acid aminotransferase [SAR202 cluster bacterium]